MTWWVSLVALATAVAASVAVGSVPISLDEVAGAVVRGATGRLDGPRDVIVWEVRWPRSWLAAATGAALALAGVVYQAVFRNPLADPYLLGAASGAGLGAALVLVAGGSAAWATRVGVAPAAFVVAAATVAAVVVVARGAGTGSTTSLILAGVVLGSAASAATSFLMLADRERTAGVLAWLLGSFAFATHVDVARLLPAVVVAVVLARSSHRWFDVVQLGRSSARHLGVRTEALTYLSLTGATLVTAMAVSVAGVVGFVGLVVPHAVRLVAGPRHAALFVLAPVWGATFLVLADLVARTVLAPTELPVGIVTALVGAPVFLLLLRRTVPA